MLNDALDAAGLFTLQEDAGEASITLDTKISSAGGNLSVGQRQIIALARAMIRGSKLLMLDEGESSGEGLCTVDSLQLPPHFQLHLPLVSFTYSEMCLFYLTSS